MNLRILVTEAAYADQQNNSLIVYELVPRYFMVDDGEDLKIVSHTLPHDKKQALSPKLKTRSTTAGSWMSTPCMRQSDLLEALHQHLIRKHPHLLLPAFPRATRKTPGWGTDTLLMTLKTKLERYFSRLLLRPEFQEDPAIYEFLSVRVPGSANGEDASIPNSAPSQLGGSNKMWTRFNPKLWFRNGMNETSANLCDEVDSSRVLLHYQPKAIQSSDLPLDLHERYLKSIERRQESLNIIIDQVGSAMSAIKTYSEILGKVSRSLHDVTNSHIRHLLMEEQEPNGDNPPFETVSPTKKSSNPTLAQSLELEPPTVKFMEMRGKERRFREFGERFLELVNLLQPGFQKMVQSGQTSIADVAADQIEDLNNVKIFISKPVIAMKRLDESLQRRSSLETEYQAAVIDQGTHNRTANDVILKKITSLEDVMAEERLYRRDFEVRLEDMKREVSIHWQILNGEFIRTLISTAAKNAADVQVHLDLLRAWFPATQLGQDGKTENRVEL